MGNVIKGIEKAGIGLGILGLSYGSLNAQEKETSPLIVKAGLAYNIVDINGLSKNTFGVETLFEKGINKKLYGEWEIGMYVDTRSTNSFIYSKMQTNLGLKYKPFIIDGWSAGGKLALGVSSEFYKYVESAHPNHRVALNKLVGLDVEKKFKNGRGVNASVSKEIDRNIWRVGLKTTLKLEDKNYNNHSKRNHYPWPAF
jgi:hypothetical protein